MPCIKFSIFCKSKNSIDYVAAYNGAWGREFNKLLEAGVLLYQLMGHAGAGWWTTNGKMSKNPISNVSRYQLWDFVKFKDNNWHGNIHV